jgi:type VI secretion system FHA domain protein
MSLCLTLEVINAGPAVMRAQFAARGGQIGRTLNNDLTLPAAGVSRHHATVHWHNGEFLIEDRSANGMRLNGDPMPQQQALALQDGDRLSIDEYEIAVRIAPLAAAQATEGDPHGAYLGESARGALPLLDAAAESAAPLPPAWNHSSGLADHFVPPPLSPSEPPPAAAGVIPENWDLSILQKKGSVPAARVAAPPRAAADEPLTAEVPAPAAATAPVEAPLDLPIAPVPPPRVDTEPVFPPCPPGVATQAPAGSANPGAPGDDMLRSLLAGAGIDPAQVTPELLRTLGEVLRVMIDGTLEALRMRAQTKSEFRLDMTRAQVSGNNPLKFAANVEDALHGLFARRNAAYLGPVEAFRDAFDDLHAHQLAMLAGFREAYQALLREFDPATLREQFERQSRSSSLLRLAGRARFWDLYEQHFAARTADAEDAFRELFGDPFSEAYERQFRRFRQASRKGAP